MLVYKKPVDEAPCKKTCPAEIDVPRYVRYTSLRKFNEALAVIREKIPFPSVCGRLCFAPCEKTCRLNEENDAVAIKMLKRFVAERKGRIAFSEKKLREPTGKRVAIIGSGPAGLTSAYYLAKLGHSLVVFEKLRESGGMMRGDSRLPAEILDQEIDGIKAVGVEIKTGVKAISLDDLFQDGFEAVFIALASRGTAKKNGPSDKEATPDYDPITDMERNLEVDSLTLATNIKRVFALGDDLNEKKSVIHAIAAGKKAATHIDRVLGGDGIIDEELVPSEDMVVDPMEEIPTGKTAPVGLPIEPRYPSDKEQGYDEETAVREAKRCLRCDLPIVAEPAKCVGCLLCTLRCSYRTDGSNFSLANINIERAGKSNFERRISFKDDCDNCHLCVNICPYGALSTTLVVER